MSASRWDATADASANLPGWGLTPMGLRPKPHWGSTPDPAAAAEAGLLKEN